MPSQRDGPQTKGLSWTSGSKYVKEGFFDVPEERGEVWKCCQTMLEEGEIFVTFCKVEEILEILPWVSSSKSYT